MSDVVWVMRALLLAVLQVQLYAVQLYAVCTSAVTRWREKQLQ